jgi:hypothetical protein
MENEIVKFIAENIPVEDEYILSETGMVVNRDFMLGFVYGEISCWGDTSITIECKDSMWEVESRVKPFSLKIYRLQRNPDTGELVRILADTMKFDVIL